MLIRHVISYSKIFCKRIQFKYRRLMNKRVMEFVNEQARTERATGAQTV
jgi:hypothetical protein